jgi:DNA-binding response OmpR family regulator
VDRPVTKEDIFEHVYGRFAGIHSRCLDMLVGRLRKKLALTGNKCRIFSVRNLGYKMVVKVNV